MTKLFRIGIVLLLACVAVIASAQYGKYELHATFEGQGRFENYWNFVGDVAPTYNGPCEWKISVIPITTTDDNGIKHANINGTLKLWLQWVPGTSNESAPPITYVGESYTSWAYRVINSVYDPETMVSHSKVNGVEDHLEDDQYSSYQIGRHACTIGPKPYAWMGHLQYNPSYSYEPENCSAPMTQVRVTPDANGKVLLEQHEISSTANGDYIASCQYLRSVKIGFVHSNLQLSRTYNVTDTTKLFGPDPTGIELGKPFTLGFPSKVMPGVSLAVKAEGTADLPWYRGIRGPNDSSVWHQENRTLMASLLLLNGGQQDLSYVNYNSTSGVASGTLFALCNPDSKPVMKVKIRGNRDSDKYISSQKLVFNPHEETAVYLSNEDNNPDQKGDPEVKEDSLIMTLNSPGTHTYSLVMRQVDSQCNVLQAGTKKTLTFVVLAKPPVTLPQDWALPVSTNSRIDTYIPITGGVAPYTFIRKRMPDTMTITYDGHIEGYWVDGDWAHPVTVDVFDATGKCTNISLPLVERLDSYSGLDDAEGLALIGLPIRGDDYAFDGSQSNTNAPMGSFLNQSQTSNNKRLTMDLNEDPIGGELEPSSDYPIKGTVQVTREAVKSMINHLIESPFSILPAQSRRGPYIWFTIAGNPHIGLEASGKVEPRANVQLKGTLKNSWTTKIFVQSQDAAGFQALKAKWARRLPNAQVVHLDNVLRLCLRNLTESDLAMLQVYYANDQWIRVKDADWIKVKEAINRLKVSPWDSDAYTVLEQQGFTSQLFHIRRIFWTKFQTLGTDVIGNSTVVDLLRSHWSWLQKEGGPKDGAFVAIGEADAYTVEVVSSAVAKQKFPQNKLAQQVRTLCDAHNEAVAKVEPIDAAEVTTKLDVFHDKNPATNLVGWINETMPGVASKLKPLAGAGKIAGRGIIIIGITASAVEIYEGKNLTKGLVKLGSGVAAAAATGKVMARIAAIPAVSEVLIAQPWLGVAYGVGSLILMGYAYVAAETAVDYLWNMDILRLNRIPTYTW